MESMANDMTYFWLIWLGIGAGVILIGIFMLAYEGNVRPDESVKRTENQVFDVILEEKTTKLPKEPNLGEREIFSQIIQMSDSGKVPREIAKLLKMGVGEVELILSLYKRGIKNES